MTKRLENIVVIAAYDDRYIDACLASLGTKYRGVVIDTSKGGYTTGAYIEAYREYEADNYFFMQDTMFAKQPDYLQPFIDKKPEHGAVAWCLFHMSFDTSHQEERTREIYGDDLPDYGIFGPVFYVSRKDMETLDEKGLLPPIPRNKLEAQTTERMWACAFKNAGMEVTSVGGLWDHDAMARGDYMVFGKTFAGRS